ncbi:MAG TPA: four helix bundle protein [Candidatus Angelobacter sp.]|nr:four helix bundle protein [Candidatus Angelobacter sp.]
MRNYRDLQTWNKAHNLTLELYKLSRQFPKEEIYGLTSQLRRAASSIGANLAEGCGRQTNSEFARFVRISMGSASELDYHLLLSRDLGLLENDAYQRTSKNLTEVRKMLASLLSTVEIEAQTRSKAVAKG